MHYHKTYIYSNYQQNRVCRSVKTVHTNSFGKIANCINLQLAIRISKNHAFLDMHYLLTDIQANFEINRPIRYQITEKGNYFHRRQIDGQIDRQTDGRTDGQTSRTTTIGSFFQKKKKILKTHAQKNCCT